MTFDHQLPTINRLSAKASVFVVAAMLTTGPVLAQSNDDVDAELLQLIDAAQSPETGISAARAQVASGDLTGAASTLERTLIANRNADNVRALYATILCKLDDQKGARQEIGLLGGRKTDPAFLSELNAACGALTKAASSKGSSGGHRSGVSGNMSLGLIYETDAVGSYNIQSSAILLPPLPVKFTDDGLASTQTLNVNGKSVAASGSSWIYGGLAVQSQIKVSGPVRIGAGEVGYQIGKFRTGFGGQSGNTQYEIGPVVQHARIFNRAYASEFGGQARLSFANGESKSILAGAEIVYQDYTAFGGNTQADGFRFDVSLASLSQPEKGGYVLFGAGLEYKEAQVSEYFAGRIFASGKFPIDEGGSYASLSGTYRYVDFANAVIGSRNDHRLFFRGALGTPLGSNGFFIEAGASYTMRSSSATNLIVLGHNSLGIELRLIKKFGQ